MQDHKVFARHKKFGTFQVPKEFLNTNKQASAAVAPKRTVRQARQSFACPLWHDMHMHMCRAACISRRHKVQYCLISYTSRESLHLGTFTPLHLGCTIHLGVVTRSSLRLVILQVSKADGWHGARRMARADKQQTQPKQKQQKQQKQKQQKQTQQKQRKQKQPTDGSQTRVPSFTSDPAGAVGVEARIPAIAHTASKSRNVLAISPPHAPCLLFVGRIGDRVS